MVQDNKPEYLYKYFSNPNYALNIIVHNLLYMSNPTEFNDPFDLHIKPNVNISNERYKQHMRTQYDKNINGFRDKIPIEQFNEYLESKIYCTEAEKEKIIAGAMSGILSHGIFCLTELYNNMKFWAVYANNHKGLCIKFKPDYTKVPFSQCARVEYNDIYPDVGIDNEEYYYKLFTTKHSDWEDEKEWRIILNKKVMLSIQQQMRIAPKLVPIEGFQIDSIICGYNMEPRQINIIKSWIALSNFAEIHRPKLLTCVHSDGLLSFQNKEIALY
jgi:hypothetical protein